MSISAKTAWVLYSRVSTAQQGRSALGIEGQQAALSAFLAGRPDDRVVGAFVEVESGRDDTRPQLARALDMARLHGARLLIAKLDRLSRDVCFIASLMKSDVSFTVADMPGADPFRLHIEACFAEDEARKISQRTRSALAAAKARGKRLGGFRGRAVTSDEQAKGRATQTARATAQALRLAPLLGDLRANGATTFQHLADGLNAACIPAPRGGTWYPAQVARIERRCRALRLA